MKEDNDSPFNGNCENPKCNKSFKEEVGFWVIGGYLLCLKCGDEVLKQKHQTNNPEPKPKNKKVVIVSKIASKLIEQKETKQSTL